jgi:KDO2-lipid IV(A) lauroyltransferase
LRLISALIPPAWLFRIGKLAKPFLQFQAREARQRAIRWILAALPGTTPQQAARIAGESIVNDMFGILDDLVLLRPARRQMLHCTGVQGMQHLDQAVGAGHGVILLTAHFCATRIALTYLATLGYPALAVQNPTPERSSEGGLGSLLRPRYMELRRQGNADVVYLQDPECSLKILRRLRSGGLVHVHLDTLNAKRAVQGTFLGLAWRFPAGTFDLVRLSGCAVVPLLSLGNSTGFQIHCGPTLSVRSAASSEEFVNANLPAFTEVLERQIAGHPGEWRTWTWV